MRVLITGAAGRLGRVLVPMLLAEPRVSALIAHDQHPMTSHHPKLRVLQGDIRDPALSETIAGADAVVHMAFVVIASDLRGGRHNGDLARSINRDGTLAVLSALRPEARLVYLSSASVYGTSRSPARETQPLAPLPGFQYAQDKVFTEQAIVAAEAKKAIHAVRLRPHIILGPQAQPFLKGVLRLPFYPRLPHPAPRLQLVHEIDVAAAIAASVFTEATGAINLACNDSLSFEDMQRRRHRVAIGVSPPLARAAARFAFHTLAIGPDPAWSSGLEFPLLLDTTRAREELNWVPRFPRASEILADTFR